MLVLGLSSVGAFAFDEAAEDEGAKDGRATASFDFEDGLDGWTVEDGLGTSDTWVHFDEVDGSEGVIGLSSYQANAQTRIVSPAVDVPADAVLEFRASYWTEGGDYDFVDLLVQDSEGAWQALDRVQGRGRWPLWDHHRYQLPVQGEVRIAMEFASDEFCSGGAVKPSLAEFQLNGSNCGQGFWFDDILVAPAAAFDGPLPAAWGDGPAAHPIVAPVTGTNPDLVAVAGQVAAVPPTSLGSNARSNEYHDQASNPDFLEAMEAHTSGELHLDDWWRDPLVEFEGKLGESRDEWVINRYGTPLGVRMFAPLDDEPHPLLVFVGAHGGGGWSAYESMLRRLVQEGFVVASLVPQGDGWFSSYRSAVLPAPEFCGSAEATANAWWRQPQEAGLSETEACAGFQGVAQGGPPDVIAESYRTSFGPAFALSTLDVVDWALSDDNPWRDRIHGEAGVGTFGNSAGAWAALVAAQVDERVRAAVMLDGYGTLGGMEPTTPTLALTHDQYDLAGDLHHNPLSVAEDLVGAGVDAGFLFNLDTGHLDSAWTPFMAGDAGVGAVHTVSNAGNTKNPLAKPIFHHYLLAWFDRFLNGEDEAAQRLTMDVFDGSADRTAQGQGQWGSGVGNVPYTIEGRTVADHLNPAVSSWISLDGQRANLAG